MVRRSKGLTEVSTLEGYRVGSIEYIPADPDGDWHPFTSDSYLTYERADRDYEWVKRFGTWDKAVRHLLITEGLDPTTPTV